MFPPAARCRRWRARDRPSRWRSPRVLRLPAAQDSCRLTRRTTAPSCPARLVAQSPVSSSSVRSERRTIRAPGQLARARPAHRARVGSRGASAALLGHQLRPRADHVAGGGEASPDLALSTFRPPRGAMAPPSRGAHAADARPHPAGAQLRRYLGQDLRRSPSVQRVFHRRPFRSTRSRRTRAVPHEHALRGDDPAQARVDDGQGCDW